MKIKMIIFKDNGKNDDKTKIFCTHSLDFMSWMTSTSAVLRSWTQNLGRFEYIL